MVSQSSKEVESAIEATAVDENGLDLNDPVAREKRGTEHDGRDMNRMGKLPELRVWFYESSRSCRIQANANISATSASLQFLGTQSF
jgi:hypothetical protein